MLITGYAFNYSLKAASHHRHGRYRLTYSKATGAWSPRRQQAN
jgi:hypothetical protein